MSTLRKASDIRFYLYLSETKLNMLNDQIFENRRKVKKTLKVKIPFVSGQYETEPSDEIKREEMLLEVEEELEERQLVGTIEEPKTYFKGIMRMRWGIFIDLGYRPKDEPALVFFGGRAKEGPIMVGLGGSSRHVYGHEGASSTYSRSTTPTIVRWLMAGIHDDAPPNLPKVWGWDYEKQELNAAIGIALHYLRPPTQDLQFLAKTLHVDTLHGHEHMTGVPSTKVILGTPLYVVQAHPTPEPATWGLDERW